MIIILSRNVSPTHDSDSRSLIYARFAKMLVTGDTRTEATTSPLLYLRTALSARISPGIRSQLYSRIRAHTLISDMCAAYETFAKPLYKRGSQKSRPFSRSLCTRFTGRRAAGNTDKNPLFRSLPLYPRDSPKYPSARECSISIFVAENTHHKKGSSRTSFLAHALSMRAVPRTARCLKVPNGKTLTLTRTLDSLLSDHTSQNGSYSKSLTPPLNMSAISRNLRRAAYSRAKAFLTYAHRPLLCVRFPELHGCRAVRASIPGIRKFPAHELKSKTGRDGLQTAPHSNHTYRLQRRVMARCICAVRFR